jgi:acyl carrier protein
MDIKKIVQNSIKKLQNDNEIPSGQKINDKSVIMGDGALLDSISIVNFFMHIENEISKQKGKKFIIKLQNIHKLNKGKTSLLLGDFTKVLKKII